MGDFLLNHLENVRKWLHYALAIAGLVLLGTLAVGCLLFELDAMLVVGWFCTVIGVILAGLLVWAILVFLFWFLLARPCNILVFIIAVLLIIGAAFAGLEIMDSVFPVFDLGALIISLIP